MGTLRLKELNINENHYDDVFSYHKQMSNYRHLQMQLTVPFFATVKVNITISIINRQKNPNNFCNFCL